MPFGAGLAVSTRVRYPAWVLEAFVGSQSGHNPKLAVDVLVDAPVDAVRERLKGGTLSMRSLWFPSLADLRAWDRASESLWIRWTDERAFALGPRLFNVSAARFCPEVRATLEAEGVRTRIRGTRHYPAFATGLLAVWTGALAVWLLLGLWMWRTDPAAQDAGLGWLLWWAIVAGALLVAFGVGSLAGGRALDAALPDLARVARDEGAAEDDWG